MGHSHKSRSMAAAVASVAVVAAGILAVLANTVPVPPVGIEEASRLTMAQDSLVALETVSFKDTICVGLWDLLLLNGSQVGCDGLIITVCFLAGRGLPMGTSSRLLA